MLYQSIICKLSKVEELSRFVCVRCIYLSGLPQYGSRWILNMDDLKTGSPELTNHSLDHLSLPPWGKNVSRNYVKIWVISIILTASSSE